MPRKKSKDGASSSRSYDANKFWNEDAFRVYESTISRSIIPERGIDMSHHDCDVVQSVLQRRWVDIAQSPPDAVVSVVREFYANLRVKHEDYGVLVRGQLVFFDPATINSIYNLPEFDNDEYTAYVNGPVDYEAIISRLCIPGAEWRLNQGHPVTLKKSELQGDPRSWASFILSRIMPSSHQTEITSDKVALIYAIVTGKTVDLGQLIHSSILRAGTGNMTVSLPCPHTVTALCLHAGVQWGADEHVLKAKSPITVYVGNPFRRTDEQNRLDARRVYNQRARARQPPPPPAVPRDSLGDRMFRLERDMRAQRREQVAHRHRTDAFMSHMMDFTSVFAQRFPPPGPDDAPWPPQPAWPPQYPPQDDDDDDEPMNDDSSPEF